jgi:hypothetical protein
MSVRLATDAEANGQTIQVLTRSPQWATKRGNAWQRRWTHLCQDSRRYALNRIQTERGRPAGIVPHNGPELRERAMEALFNSSCPCQDGRLPVRIIGGQR